MNFKKGNTNLEIWIDKPLFETIENIKDATQDEKNYVVMTMVSLLALMRENEYAYVNVESMLMTLQDELKLSLKTKTIKGFTQGIVLLQNCGLVEITGEMKKNQIFKIDISKMKHKKENSYFQLSQFEVYQMMKGNSPHHLFTIFCNLASRWNMESYAMYDEYGWDKHEDRYYDTNLQLYKYLSCYPTQEELTTTWCSRPNKKGEDGFHQIDRSTQWNVTRASINNYINEMIDLKIIKRITKNIGGKNRNYYCRPMHSQCVKEVLDILEEQRKFATK